MISVFGIIFFSWEETTMEALDAIMTRRSIRSFEKRKVEKEKLEKVVDAGRHAASGMNTQGWHFTVITDAEKLRELGAYVQGNDTSICYDAPAFIIVSYEKGNAFAPYDTSCALENMMLASHALGLGSVWINRINKTPEKAENLVSFGVPAGYRAYGCLALGYPAAGPKDKELKEGTVTWIE